MATDDKFENKAEEVKGQVKEKTGQVKGDDKMRAEGKAEQSKANLKQAGENVKDAFKK
ncbi:MAG TPA: CsbD family protein [Nocardioidaceae bacterium]